MWLYGILLLVLYGMGHCAVIVLAGTSTGLVQHYLDWNEKSRGAVVLKRVCGALVVAAGLYRGISRDRPVIRSMCCCKIICFRQTCRMMTSSTFATQVLTQPRMRANLTGFRCRTFG